MNKKMIAILLVTIVLGGCGPSKKQIAAQEQEIAAQEQVRQEEAEKKRQKEVEKKRQEEEAEKKLQEEAMKDPGKAGVIEAFKKMQKNPAPDKDGYQIIYDDYTIIEAWCRESGADEAHIGKGIRMVNSFEPWVKSRVVEGDKVKYTVHYMVSNVNENGKFRDHKERAQTLVYNKGATEPTGVEDGYPEHKVLEDAKHMYGTKWGETEYLPLWDDENIINIFVYNAQCDRDALLELAQLNSDILEPKIVNVTRKDDVWNYHIEYEVVSTEAGVSIEDRKTMQAVIQYHHNGTKWTQLTKREAVEKGTGSNSSPVIFQIR